AWLDYDGKLDEQIVEDVGFCARKFNVGSILLVTVNAESGMTANQIKGEAAKLSSRLAARRLPSPKTLPKAIAGNGYAALIRTILTQELQSKSAKAIRGNKVAVKQFLFFSYRDNARMCTLGWYFDDPAPAQGTLSQCVLPHLPQFAPGPTPFSIDAPVLTPREV